MGGGGGRKRCIRKPVGPPQLPAGTHSTHTFPGKGRPPQVRVGSQQVPGGPGLPGRPPHPAPGSRPAAARGPGLPAPSPPREPARHGPGGSTKGNRRSIPGNPVLPDSAEEGRQHPGGRGATRPRGRGRGGGGGGRGPRTPEPPAPALGRPAPGRVWTPTPASPHVARKQKGSPPPRSRPGPPGPGRERASGPADAAGEGPGTAPGAQPRGARTPAARRGGAGLRRAGPPSAPGPRRRAARGRAGRGELGSCQAAAAVPRRVRGLGDPRRRAEEGRPLTRADRPRSAPAS